MSPDFSRGALPDRDDADPTGIGTLRIVATYVLMFLLAPLVVLSFANYLDAYSPIFFGDADWYATAWPALVGDAPLYPPEILQPHLTVRPPTFKLPPSTAIFTLFALNRMVWGVSMLACLIGGLAIVWPRIGLWWTVVLAGVLLIWLPVQSAIVWANLNSFIFLMLCIAVRWTKVAPIAVGFAIAAKVVPIFLLPWILATHGWRGVATAVAIPLAATVAIVALTSPSVLWEFFVVRFNEIHLPSLSVTDVLGVPSWVGYVGAAALAVVSWRRKSFAIGVIACLVAVPALHVHYFVLLLVPLLASAQPALPMERRAVPQPA